MNELSFGAIFHRLPAGGGGRGGQRAGCLERRHGASVGLALRRDGGRLAVAGPAGHGRDPSLGFDSAGNALMVWAQPGQTLAARRFFKETAWCGAPMAHRSAPTSAAAWGTTRWPWRRPAPPSPPGRAQSAPRRASRRAPTTRFTDRWGTTAQLAADDGSVGANVNRPTVAVDRLGNAWAAWGDRTSAGTATIRVRRYTASSAAWSSGATLTSTTGEAFWPRIALDDAGRALAIWRSREIVQSARYTTAFGWAPPPPQRPGIAADSLNMRDEHHRRRDRRVDALERPGAPPERRDRRLVARHHALGAECRCDQCRAAPGGLGRDNAAGFVVEPSRRPGGDDDR